MTLTFMRVFFVIISGFIGFYLGSTGESPWVGVAVGVAAAGLLILMEASLHGISVRGLTSMVFGLLLGVFMAKLIADILSLLPLGDFFHSVSRVILTLIFSYLGAVMALRGKDEFNIIIPYVRFQRQDLDERMTLLDTSAIIDGRVADIYKTNFFTGQLVVPRFVLQELQKISDSETPTKRQRGRRGMEILRGMQKNPSIDLIVHEDDVPGQGVDAKLVRLAKVMDARVCTTDYNLGRIATIQGIQILNINELVTAVKPTVLPGEEMTIRLLKEGREPNQAVGYTEDGTMVVVADAKSAIGQEVNVTVTSVLQTQAGRMIFGKKK